MYLRHHTTLKIGFKRQDDLKGKPTELFTDIYSCSVVSRWFSEGSYFLTWLS